MQQGRWKNIFNLPDAACKKSILTLLVLIFLNFSKINSLEKRKENEHQSSWISIDHGHLTVLYIRKDITV